MPSAAAAIVHGRRRPIGGAISSGVNFVAMARPSTTPPDSRLPWTMSTVAARARNAAEASMWAFVTASIVT